MLLEDFYADVLHKLGVLAAEEAPEAADREKVVEKYGQMLEKWTRRDQPMWFDDEDVPDWIADSFSSMVAFSLTATFAVPDDKYLKLKMASDEGETQLIGDGQRRDSPAVETKYY